MFERLLVPLDRTTLAAETISFAAQIPSRHVRLLHVTPATPPGATGRANLPNGLPPSSIGKLRAWGLEFGSRGRDVEMTVAHGDPVERIVQASADADLIVLVTFASGAHTRSIADRIARRAPVPTVLVRGGRRTSADPIARIVVPLDGSDPAEEALPVAERFGTAIGVPLHLIRVVNRAAILIGREAGFREANDYLKAVVRSLARKGLTATSDVRFGPVASSLRDAVEPNDLVVMANHGRGGLRRWLLGSVTERLVEWSNAPIVLVRAGMPAGQITTAPSAGQRRPITFAETGIKTPS